MSPSASTAAVENPTDEPSRLTELIQLLDKLECDDSEHSEINKTLALARRNASKNESLDLFRIWWWEDSKAQHTSTTYWAWSAVMDEIPVVKAQQLEDILREKLDDGSIKAMKTLAKSMKWKHSPMLEMYAFFGPKMCKSRKFMDKTRELIGLVGSRERALGLLKECQAERREGRRKIKKVSGEDEWTANDAEWACKAGQTAVDEKAKETDKEADESAKKADQEPDGEADEEPNEQDQDEDNLRVGDMDDYERGHTPADQRHAKQTKQAGMRRRTSVGSDGTAIKFTRTAPHTSTSWRRSENGDVHDSDEHDDEDSAEGLDNTGLPIETGRRGTNLINQDLSTPPRSRTTAPESLPSMSSSPDNGDDDGGFMLLSPTRKDSLGLGFGLGRDATSNSLQAEDDMAINNTAASINTPESIVGSKHPASPYVCFIQAPPASTARLDYHCAHQIDPFTTNTAAAPPNMQPKRQMSEPPKDSRVTKRRALLSESLGQSPSQSLGLLDGDLFGGWLNAVSPAGESSDDDLKIVHRGVDTNIDSLPDAMRSCILFKNPNGSYAACAYVDCRDEDKVRCQIRLCDSTAIDAEVIEQAIRRDRTDIIEAVTLTPADARLTADALLVAAATSLCMHLRLPDSVIGHPPIWMYAMELVTAPPSDADRDTPAAIATIEELLPPAATLIAPLPQVESVKSKRGPHITDPAKDFRAQFQNYTRLKIEALDDKTALATTLLADAAFLATVASLALGRLSTAPKELDSETAEQIGICTAQIDAVRNLPPSRFTEGQIKKLEGNLAHLQGHQTGTSCKRLEVLKQHMHTVAGFVAARRMEYEMEKSEWTK